MNVLLFIKGDSRNVVRDPFMLFVLLAPFLMVVFLQIGVPFLDQQISELTTFRLMEHRSFMNSIIIAVAPLMVGMVTGFLLIDERDEGVLQYMDVTPIKKAGYLLYRMLLPLFIGFFVIVVMALLLRLFTFQNWLLIGFSLLLLSLNGAFVTSFLAALARNKVEAIVYSKCLSLFMLGPLIHYIVEANWVWLTYIIPITWGVEALFLVLEGNASISKSVVMIVGGTLTTVIWFLVFMIILKRKTE